MSANPKRVAIGLDVGGTKIAGAVVDLGNGEIVAQKRIPTGAERPGELILDDAVSLAQALFDVAERLGHNCVGIGIGVPEIVDPDGAIQTEAVIGWQYLPVRERLSRIAPSVIEADVRAAALAEARFGAGRAFPSFAYITIGTGISSTIVRNGVPDPGARGAALVLASMPLDVTCASCGERTGLVLEEFAAGPAVARRYGDATGGDVAGAEAVVMAADRGDETAREILRSAGDEIGVSIAFLVNVTDPHGIVIGGGFGSAGGAFWDALDASTRTHIWNPHARDLRIVRTTFGADSGMIGAALAAERANQ